MMTRSGRSILEVLIVVAILGILIGLLLAGIQKMREASLRTQTKNNLRQMMMGYASHSSKHGDKVSGLPDSDPNKTVYRNSGSIFNHIRLELFGKSNLPNNPTKGELTSYTTPSIRIFHSPADPSIGVKSMSSSQGKISYAANMMAFDKAITYPVSIPDGTANTIAIAEKYWWVSMLWSGDSVTRHTCYHDYQEILPGVAMSFANRRATFADFGSADIVPTYEKSTGELIIDTHFQDMPLKSKTFEVRPLYTNTWCDRLQTPFAAGLPVAMFDGSVRILSPSIEPKIFWGLVTPAGGEIVWDF
ncbi:MAG: DUF1559 domain-containing protein [Fimbriiglobus sp.]